MNTEFKSEYYRPLSASMEYYEIEEKSREDAAAKMQAPEDAMFSFAMFLLM